LGAFGVAVYVVGCARRPSVCSRNRCELSSARFAQLPTYIARGAGVYRQAAAAQQAAEGGAVRPSVRQVDSAVLACVHVSAASESELARLVGAKV
jgi:hypothetical protein